RKMPARSKAIRWLPHHLVWLAIFSCGAHTVGTAAPHESVPQYFAKSWSADDGAPQSTVIVQDRDGYLWFTPGASLVRFDGIRFTVFNSANTPQIRTEFVSSIFVDHQGTLWIGTANGLVRHRDNKFTLYSTVDGLSNDNVWSITEDAA